MEATIQIEKSPHIRSGYTTHKFMFDFKLAVYPLALIAIVMQYLYVVLRLDATVSEGLFVAFKAFLIIIVAVITSIMSEGIWWKYVGKRKYGEGLDYWFRMNATTYPAITGILFAFTLPIGTPLYVVFLGSVFAIIIGKTIFGGLGRNIFNPALVGRGFVALSFGSQLSTSYADFIEGTSDAITGATPLSVNALSDGLLKFYEYRDGFSLLDLFFGLHPSSIGESFAFWIIIAFAILVFKKVISWYVPVIYVGVMFLMVWGVAYMTDLGGGDGLGTLAIYFPLYHILAGGLLFGAVFMVTEPVTSPVTPKGRIVFALYASVITFAIRFLGNLPEGVAFSILFMNMFTPMIDDAFGPQDKGITWKEAIFWLVTLGIVVGVTIYAGYQLGGSL